MRKYVNEREKPVITEFVWIDNQIVTEVRSIELDKKTIDSNNILVVSRPYILAIYGKEGEDKNKSLAVLDFSE